MEWTWLIGGVAVTIMLIYKYLTWNWDHWKKRGIPEVKPTSIFFGNIGDVMMMKKHSSILYDDIYKSHPDEPVVGMFKMRTPQLMIRDVDLIRHMFIKEFSSFHDNDFMEPHPNDYISHNHPFMARGERWKKIRAVNAKALTGVKIKGMVEHMVRVCKDMNEYMLENQHTDIDAKELCSRYTGDVVTGCVYGLHSNMFKDPDSSYMKQINSVFNPDWKRILIFLFITFMPSLTRLFRIDIFPKTFVSFYENIVKDTIKYRKEKDLKGTDFLQILLDENKYTFKEITAFSLTFIIDGHETSSSQLANTLDYLANFPDAQDKLRNEVKATLTSLDDITFDKLHSMPYLNAVLLEVLRLRPPGALNIKLCTKDINIDFKGKTYKFKKDESLVYSILSSQNDPKYYDDPEVFRPERFIDGPSNHPAYMPFGVGPRTCIGQLFAMTQLKAAISTIVMDFQVIPKKAYTKPPPFDTYALLLLPEGGIHIKLQKLDK